jgi:hypothetical protein
MNGSPLPKPAIFLSAARQRGFALIVTLSLMVLLSVIAIGLLGLSATVLRSTSRGSAQAMADSNARLALMLAIGELQKSLGPDQRISASASAFGADLAQPNLVGAWEAQGWQGPDGAPPSPSSKQERFQRWLTSSPDPRLTETFAYGQSAEPADAVWLSNPETTGSLPTGGNTTVRAPRVPISGRGAPGGLAWAVSDESLKAPLNIAPPASGQAAQNIASRTAAPAPRPDVLDPSLAGIAGSPRLVSLGTAALAVGQPNRQQVTARSQALTTSSIGLLTNPVTGGFKSDLTQLMEAGTSGLPAGAFPGESPYFAAADGAPSWEYLRSHYQLHRRLNDAGSSKPKLAMNVRSPELTPARNGLDPTPRQEKLLPVIAKLQIIFSLVSHHSHIGDRVSAFNSRAQPPGNNQHAVPHLVYDPVVTLYNPYDVQLELPHLRIQISDPPVGFQFMKHDLATGSNAWYRQEFGSGEFHGLARFQIDNERVTSARKVFTLFLRDRSANGNPGGALTLLPGEVKVFSPWVESRWTWGFETGTGYNPRAFFDWNVQNNFGNRDNRTNNAKGVETVPGLDFRAGLQTDHLSYGSGRSQESRYSWETSGPFGAGWLSVKLSDDVTVNARPQRVVSSANLPDFRVDILAGRNDNATLDILRTYEFKLNNVAAELSPGSDPKRIISRRFKNASILQAPDDPTPGGKSPFAIFTMTAKTTRDMGDDSKSWIHNNMVTEGGRHESGLIGNAAQSYDLRLQEIYDFTDFPGVEYDDATRRGYFGAIANASGGVSIVPRYRVPVTPAASLGDWIASNLVASSQFPRVGYPLGNSFAHPLIPSNGISAPSPMPQGGRMLDHSYLMNASLWDHYYFSSATSYNSSAFSTPRSKSKVLEDFFTGREPMLNSRLAPHFAGTADPTTLANEYAAMDELEFAKKFGANAVINGAFNVNSTSVDAWRSVLSSLRDVAVAGYAGQTFAVDEKTAFVRNGLPVAGSADGENAANTVNAQGQIRWAGFRALDDSQIENLSRAIVEEIRARAAQDGAPSLSLADFINRRLGAPTEVHALKGILQTAIDRSGINAEYHEMDSNEIVAARLPADRTRGLANPQALEGFTADGAAPFLTQGDLLTGLAPIITARGDTFTIRAYGEARTPDGNSVLARSWCEAVVQRTPEFVDATDAPESLVDSLSETNRNFGRRFVLVSFRWLSGEEI